MGLLSEGKVTTMGAEKRFENKVKKFLIEQGCYFIKYWGGGKFTKSGITDLLICCNSYFLGVEIKSSTGRPSELQLWNINQIKKAGGIGIVLYPEQFDFFKDLILKLKGGITCNIVIQEFNALTNVDSNTNCGISTK